MITVLLVLLVVVLVACLFYQRAIIKGCRGRSKASLKEGPKVLPQMVRLPAMVLPPPPSIAPSQFAPVHVQVPEARVITEQFEAVRDFIRQKEKLILVTGGAGTGKTTLVQWLQEPGVLPFSNIAVVAFTGVAALVCRGKTIHSFFSLPPTTILSNTALSNISSSRASVLQNLELLIIDEISMVRADLMDAVDRRLRKTRNSNEPFAGVPVLMVGDPCQLPPVVGEKERKLFSIVPSQKMFQQWDSGWFFHAKVFAGQKMQPVLLTKTFRQQDASAEYLEHLSKMRALSLTNRHQQEVMDYFNEYCYEEGCPLLDHALTITFTNAQADDINAERLRCLSGEEYQFTAVATGYFAGANNQLSQNQFTPKLPAPYTLSLKVGAQVMLLINDSERGFVNGTLATIIAITAGDIMVSLPGGREVLISPYDWVSEDYVYNPVSKSIERVTDGSYRQYPLTLAWAFTAHKSQGKTLDRVNIITECRSFASGQAYVALSRTRRIEDMKLSAPLSASNFVIDRDLLLLKGFLK